MHTPPRLMGLLAVTAATASNTNRNWQYDIVRNGYNSEIRSEKTTRVRSKITDRRSVIYTRRNDSIIAHLSYPRANGNVLYGMLVTLIGGLRKCPLCGKWLIKKYSKITQMRRNYVSVSEITLYKLTPASDD